MNAKTLRIMPCLMLLACCLGTPAVSGFYDPSIQRWVNRDPIGESGGRNLYKFVHNSPTRYIDPNGQFVFRLCQVMSCQRKINKWASDCKKNLPNCDNAEFDDEWPGQMKRAECLGFRKDLVKQCIDNADEMIKGCSGAVNPVPPPIIPWRDLWLARHPGASK
jgi:hypothetical protein